MQQERRKNDEAILLAVNSLQGDVSHIKKRVEKLDDSLNGNGRPGLKQDIARMKIQVMTLWGILIAAITSFISGIADHIKW